MALIPQRATSNPRRPPIELRARLSITICAINSERLAPRALPIARCFCRAIARVNTRFARLAQAISRINPTADNRTSRLRRRSLPTSSTYTGKIFTPKPALRVGFVPGGACQSRPFQPAPAPGICPGAIARKPAFFVDSILALHAARSVHKVSKCRASAVASLSSGRQVEIAGRTPTIV